MKYLKKLRLNQMPAKKADPNYTVLRGHIPRALFKKFKIFCLEQRLDNSQALERILHQYFEDTDKQDGEKNT